MKKANIICFPFAGGNKHSYNQIIQAASKELNFICTELPGRGERTSEAFITDMDLLVEDLYQQIQREIEKPYIFFGHSMGGLICYFLTKKIIKNKKPKPLHLIISGCHGPSVENHDDSCYLLPKEEFINKIHQLGGISEEVYENRALMDYLVPILRADFQITDTYPYRKDTPMNVPMTVLHGKSDDITEDEVALWQQETTRSIEVVRFEGNHFFIFDNIQQILQIISKYSSINTLNSTV